MTTFIVILIVVSAILLFYILVVRRLGNLPFWKTVNKYPDDAYDFFLTHDCWIVFEGKLPKGYRSKFPTSEWDGPFVHNIPKLDFKRIHILGRIGEYEKSQQEFLRLVGEDSK